VYVKTKTCNASGTVIATTGKEDALVVNLLILYTGRFVMFSVITNIYHKKTKGPTLMELFTATGKLKKFFFFYN